MPRIHHVEVAVAVGLSGVHRLHRSVGDAREEAASREIHGHSYEVEAAVRAPIDPSTGMALDITILRRALEQAVAPLVGRLMDEVLDAPATSENIAVWIWDRLADHAELPGLHRITISRRSGGDAVTYRGETTNEG